MDLNQTLMDSIEKDVKKACKEVQLCKQRLQDAHDNLASCKALHESAANVQIAEKNVEVCQSLYDDAYEKATRLIDELEPEQRLKWHLDK